MAKVEGNVLKMGTKAMPQLLNLSCPTEGYMVYCLNSQLPLLTTLPRAPQKNMQKFSKHTVPAEPQLFVTL